MIAAEGNRGEVTMSKVTVENVVCILFGVVLLLLGFVNFSQSSVLPGMPEAHTAFEQAIIDAGYVTKAVGVIEFVAGLMLLANRYVAFAAILIAPLSVNFILFKVFLDPSSLLPIPLIYAFLNAYIAWSQRAKYKALFEN